MALQPSGEGHTLGSGPAPTISSTCRVWLVQAFKRRQDGHGRQSGHGLEPSPQRSPRGLNAQSTCKGQNGWGRGEQRVQYPSQAQQKGKEATTNDKLLRWRDPHRGRGAAGCPPHPPVLHSSPPLPPPSVLLSLAHPPSQSPTLSSPSFSPSVPQSLSGSPPISTHVEEEEEEEGVGLGRVAPS